MAQKTKIRTFLKKYKGILALALVLAAINQIFSLLDPQLIRIIIDDYALKADQLTQEEFVKGVGLLLLGIVGVAFISRIAKNFQDYYVNVITQKVGTDMYAKAVDHTFSLPYAVFEDQRSGEVLQKMQKARLDTQAIITSSINIIFLTIVGLVVVLAYAFYVHWSIGTAFIVVVPFMSLLIYVLSKKIKKAQKEIVRQTADLAGSTTETIRNVELVKSLGLEHQEIKRLNSMNEKILGLELDKVKYVRLLSFLQGTLVNAMRMCLLFLMLYLLYNQTITIGEFMTLFFYSFFLFAPLGELGTVISQYQEAKASNEKLDEILQIPPQKQPKNAQVIKEIKQIVYQKVSFAYASANNPSVENIHLSISQGQTIAFAGLSGSGKTTLVKLLLGLYQPTKGNVLINNIPLKKINTQELRKKIGLVSQETQLFAGTIKENLLFVSPNASDKDCLKALEHAQCLHLVKRGNKGLNTKIGEGGLKLSGGERQRLAIARALLRNPDILIFDEATSSLDSLTEKEITKTIKAINQTHPQLITVVVAHRLSTIAHAHQIYVLEKGRISEKGSHNELLKKNGLYAALWRQQSAQN